MNGLVPAQNHGLALADDYNPFLEAGEELSRQTIVGQLLKFSKGDWLVGKEGEVVEVGTKLIANMDQCLRGYIRWSDQKPQEQLMGLVSKGFKMPKRDTLGYNDESQWEIDSNGKPQDPWQQTYYLVMKDPKVEGEEGLYTFTASSKGGMGAIGELLKMYGNAMRKRPNEYPIVSLQVGGYKHPEYGRIKTPQFDLAGWAPKSVFDDIAGGDVPEVESPSLAPSTTQF